MKKFNSLTVVLSCVLLVCNAVALADAGRNQKAVLVTGASSGIGLKIAETLAKYGFYVYAGARKEVDLERLDAMDNMGSLRLDVANQKDIDAAVDFVRRENRGLWGIVNNAGVVVLSPLSRGPDADIRFTFDVNVFGPIRVNQAFLPLIIESKGRTMKLWSRPMRKRRAGQSARQCSVCWS